MTPSITPQAFVSKWSHAALKERSAYQEHFLDLCSLLGHASPASSDPTGKFFTFEAGAEKQGGGQGWADVWYKGHFAWEYKGKHANLDKAYQQLLQYREALENPPLLIVSDIDTIVIHTNFTNTVKKTYTLTFDDILQPDRLAILRHAFYEPEKLKAPLTTEGVTKAAAGHFADLAELLRKYGEKPSEIAHFLIQLLFCLFAEDADLLPGKLFSQLLANARFRSGAFAAQLRQLFGAMATGGWFGRDEILHFDGRLFENDYVLELDSDGLHILTQVSELDWSNIEPSIFGTLFERSLDPSKRSQLGAHYTSNDDILLIVEPVLMAPLRRRWQQVQEQARDLAEKRDTAKTKGQRTIKQDELTSLLMGFAGEIASIQVLDPACGSGNFLYVALRQLLDLEKEVITQSAILGVGHFFPSVNPSQLHGIEINPYAHQLAQATIWIGYIQWLRDNGYGVPSAPILKPLDNILNMDAILAHDETRKAVEPVWPKADFIIGNPPFLGDKKMKSEMGEDYVVQLRDLYADKVAGQSDLVCYWFYKAHKYILDGVTKRAGLLSTNSIRSGVNRKVLDRITKTGKIFLAWSDRPWILDGAAVRVSMIGFDNGSENEIYLNGHREEKIFPDLTAGVDVTRAPVLLENDKLCFLGMMKAGPFDIENDVAQKMLSAPTNPNNRPNSDVVKPRLGGQDITGINRHTWIIDFGVDTPQEEASFYEIPYEYIKENVRPTRLGNNRKRLAERWWIFGEARPGLRKAIANLKRCIVTPEVAKHRVFVWMSTNIIPDHKLHVIARDDDYFFGVLQSSIHERWTLAQCSWMGVGNDPSYSSSRTFETFPFPWPPGHEPKDDHRVLAIAAAAKELVAARNVWLNPPGLSDVELQKRTLTNLYNQRPTWLDNVHKKLDTAVFAAYGWPTDLADEEILKRLLALNLERSAQKKIL